MAVRKVIQAGDPRLKRNNKLIKDPQSKLSKKLQQDLASTLKKARLVGIAANQIGENLD